MVAPVYSRKAGLKAVADFYRAQVAALPVKAGADGCEVLLITSRESHRWIVPKGWPIKGLQDHRAAAREAHEEAGVTGKIGKRALGSYCYDKRTLNGSEPCRVAVYRLDVKDEKRQWRERQERERRWFSCTEAAQLVAEPDLAAILLSLAPKKVA